MLAAKKTNPKSDITIIDDKDFDLLHTCGLPFAIDGKIKSFEELQHNVHAEQMGIRKVKGRVDSIDTKNKKVIVNDMGIDYDKLIITTGASAFKPEVKGGEDAFVIKSIKECEKLKKEARKGKTAVVVGAGAIGIETAVALKNLGLDVTLKEMKATVLPNSLDNDMSGVVKEYLEKQGIKAELGRKIDELKGYDIKVIAAGFRPNIELAKKAGIKAEKGIIVDESLKTSAKDVYAAGDCCEHKSIISKKNYTAYLATSAYKQGTIAGINAAGGNEKYSGVLGTFVSVIGELEVASTGFTTDYAQAEGIEVVSAKAKGRSKPEWYPGGKEITVKVIVNKKNKKVIGAQAVGEGAAHRINVVSAAIKAGFSAKELSDVELAYCPAVSETYDVLMQAVDLAARKMGG